MLNEQTFEFGQARLKLKDALRFSMRQTGGGIEYLVEDEVTGRFFRVGMAQYVFMTMLDGQRTVSTALMKSATLLREHAIDETEAASLCKWAIESGLVESETGNSSARRSENNDLIQKKRLVAYLNPMMIRIPLFNPDPLVNTLSRYFGFLVSPLGMFVWLMVVCYGFLLLTREWADFVQNRVNAFSATDLIWIAVTWMMLKIIHELSHSLVCKRFGGRVHSCGVLVLLLIPLPFVDVTSSWRFDNKWKRILTSAAGMMSELFIAAVACCVWVWSEPGPLQYHAGNVIISATLHTLLFNINPLMRFDGYYMLADYLEIPNLATNGRQWLKGLFKWMYFGNKPAKLKEVGFRGVAVRAYGVLAMMWFVLIAVGLSLAASSLIEGFGLMVAVIGLVLWCGVPLFQLGKYTLVGTDTEKPNRLWFTGATTATAGLIAAFLIFCPSPTVVSAPIVVDYEPLSIVRANARGFAKTIHVANGAQVNAGDVLVTLENLDLQQELRSLLTDIKISELRINTLYNDDRIAEVQLEHESLESLQQRKQELQSQIEHLVVIAPQSGQVLARDLEAIEGKYFQPGDELLSIGEPGEIHAIALTKQIDIDWVAANPTADVELRFWGRHEGSIVPGRIKDIKPRARDDLPHQAFSASIGGPLAVVPRNQVEGQGDDESKQDLMLTSPRVPVEIELSATDRASLLSGQTGELVVRSREQNMGLYLANKFTRFVSENAFRTHGL